MSSQQHHPPSKRRLNHSQNRKQDRAYPRSKVGRTDDRIGMAVATNAAYTVKRIDNDFFESI